MYFGLFVSSAKVINFNCIDSCSASAPPLSLSHGNIKPSNFLIDKYGRIKICDFGLSQKITEEPNTINLVATLA